VVELLNIDGTETFSDVWDIGAGGYAAHTSGQIDFTGEGGILSKTDVGTGAGDDVWIRLALGTIEGTDTGFAIGDSSGNIVAIIWGFGGGQLRYSDETQYSTYTTYDSDDFNINANIASYTAGQSVGITIDVSSKVTRVWVNVTADEPDSLTSWDSGAEDASYTLQSGTLHQGRLGLLSWTGSPLDDYDFFAGGDFSSGLTTEFLPQYPVLHHQLFETIPYGETPSDSS